MASYIDTALILHGLAQSTLTNIIGKRFYHIQAPSQAKRPYAVLNIVDPSNVSEVFTFSRMGQPLIHLIEGGRQFA